MGEVGGRGGALMRRTRRAVHIVIIILIREWENAPAV